MYATREEWLTAAVDSMRPWFKRAEALEPPAVRVACGWSKRSKAQAIGWCWHREASGDGVNEIQISPELAEPVKVLSTLLHEMIHASDNGDSKHRGYFRSTAIALGLTGQMTATIAGDELQVKLELLAAELGQYPHAVLSPISRSVGKQGTRMLKIECPDDGYTARTTQKWLDIGLPTCPCGSEMALAS